MLEITPAIKMICIFVVCGSFCLGFWTAKIFFERTTKIMFDELHKQYLMLLKRQGIKLNNKGKDFLNG